MFEKISNGRGGKREGAGRKKNSPNKRTAQLQKEVEESGITPLQYMLSIMRDESLGQRERLAAATAVAPYIHAKLSSVEMNANVTTHESSLDDLE